MIGCPYLNLMLKSKGSEYFDLALFRLLWVEATLTREYLSLTRRYLHSYPIDFSSFQGFQFYSIILVQYVLHSAPAQYSRAY